MNLDRKAVNAAARVMYAELEKTPYGTDAVDPEGGSDLSMCSVIMRKAIEAYEAAKKGDSE